MLTYEEATAKYGTIFGWTTVPDRYYMTEFLQTIKEEFDHPMRIVEVGTFLGGTARALAAFTGGHVTAIDNWLDFTPDEKYKTGVEGFWDIIKTHGPDLTSQVTLLEGESNDIGKAWTDPVDLVFIDGDHSLEATTKDMNNFFKHIVHGGYMLVDDYQMKSVKEAIAQWSRGRHIKVVRVPDGGDHGSQIYVIQKI